jgi:hypothetical protein
MVDTFEDGSDFGWHVGGPSSYPPTVIDSGGPAGGGDGYLELTSVGGSGPGSRLVVIAGAAWTGDYVAAGVTSIALDVINEGASAALQPCNCVCTSTVPPARRGLSMSAPWHCRPCTRTRQPSTVASGFGVGAGGEKPPATRLGVG